VLVGLSVLAAAAVLWTQRGRASARVRWYLAVLAVCELMQIVLASRQFNSRYLSPAFGLICGSMVVLLWWAHERYPQWTSRVTWVSVLALGFFLVTGVREAGVMIREARSARAELQKEEARLAASLKGLNVITYYGASTLPYALQSGSTWVYRKFAPQLDALYPGMMFWDAYGRRFENFREPVKALQNCSATILRGAPFGVQPMGFTVPDGFVVEEIGRTRQEGFYRIRSAPCLPGASGAER